jgi:hypothetical protein
MWMFILCSIGCISINSNQFRPEINRLNGNSDANYIPGCIHGSHVSWNTSANRKQWSLSNTFYCWGCSNSYFANERCKSTEINNTSGHPSNDDGVWYRGVIVLSWAQKEARGLIRLPWANSTDGNCEVLVATTQSFRNKREHLVKKPVKTPHAYREE